MTISRKPRALFILISVTLAVMLVAAGLSSLDLRMGRFITTVEEESESESEKSTPPGLSFIFIIIRISLVICFALIPLFIIYILFSPRVRRQIFVFLGVYLAFILLVHLFFRKFQFEEPIFLKGEKSIPNPPEWLVFMFSLGMSSLLLSTVLFLFRRLRRRPKPLEVVARKAQKAIEELQSGADLEAEVIRCYFEMNQVLSRQLGLKRKRTMTTREFENYLQEEGLPDIHIRRLTRLFEMVRYGAKNLGEPENRQAIACLTAIVQACQGL